MRENRVFVLVLVLLSCLVNCCYLKIVVHLLLHIFESFLEHPYKFVLREELIVPVI